MNLNRTPLYDPTLPLVGITQRTNATNFSSQVLRCSPDTLAWAQKGVWKPLEIVKNVKCVFIFLEKGWMASDKILIAGGAGGGLAWGVHLYKE